MSVNITNLTESLEALSLPVPAMKLPLVLSHLGELACAQETALVRFDVKRANDLASLTNFDVMCGPLRKDVVERLFLSRADWWVDQFQASGVNVAGLLFQTHEGQVSDAFRFASEPLIHPKQAALVVLEKSGLRSISAVVASDMNQVPPIINLVLFQSLATTVLRQSSGRTAYKPANLLTEREKECLLWSARGKTSVDIGEITGLSAHTVNHYLTNAATKLNASTRTNAIIRAIALGIIPVFEI